MPDGPNEFMLLEEVATFLRVSTSTVRHWILVGKLPSVRPGRRRLVCRKDVLAFVDGALTAHRRCQP